MTQPDSLAAVLGDFASHMLTDFDVQAILDLLVERIVDILDVTGAGVTLISSGLEPHHIAASDGTALRFEQLQTTLGQGPCISAFNSGASVAVPDLKLDERYPRFAPAAIAQGLAAVFTFPLRHGERPPLGALDLYRDTSGDLSQSELVAAQTLADVASAYLLNAEARERSEQTAARFQDLALHDPLTGLANRLLLQDRLQHAGDRANRSRRASSVLFIDLDRFKEVNDRHGHQVGDHLLVEVGRRLTALLRPGDTLARLSGDEFVLLCEDLADPTDAEQIAVRIATALSEPYLLGQAPLTLTASIGVAVTSPGHVLTAQMIADADRAMYRAKATGGNRYHVSGPHPAESPSAAHPLGAARRNA